MTNKMGNLKNHIGVFLNFSFYENPLRNTLCNGIVISIETFQRQDKMIDVVSIWKKSNYTYLVLKNQKPRVLNNVWFRH